MGEVIPICLGGMCKQARVRLIRGKAELLLRMDIVKRLDSPVNFGGGGAFQCWAKCMGIDYFGISFSSECLRLG